MITCTGDETSLPEIDRVLAINKGVVLRSLFIRLNTAQAERAHANGAPPPADVHPEGERPPRGGRAGGGGRSGGSGGGRRPPRQ